MPPPEAFLAAYFKYQPPAGVGPERRPAIKAVPIATAEQMVRLRMTLGQAGLRPAAPGKG
jgi:hypothetical protein